MIAEALISIFFGFIDGIAQLIPTESIPEQAIGALADVFVYGSYIVGSDLLLIFGGLVFTWASAKISIGLGIRIWELLPFT